MTLQESTCFEAMNNLLFGEAKRMNYKLDVQTWQFITCNSLYFNSLNYQRRKSFEDRIYAVIYRSASVSLPVMPVFVYESL